MSPRDPGVQHEQDPLQRLPVRYRLAARIAEAPLPLRQQRLNPLPQPVGDDPRRNSHRHLPARRRIPTPFLIRERVPSCRFEFSGHGRLEVVEKGFDDEVVAGLDPVAPDRLVLTERLAVDRVSN
jgi:hypothetical protein